MSIFINFRDSVMKKLAKVNKRVVCANNGGCAVVALTAYRFLGKKYPKDVHKVSIVFLFTHSAFDENERKRLSNNQAASCAHCMICINDVSGKYYIDSEGEYSWETLVKDYDFYKEVEVTPTQCLCAINHRNWNVLFSREKALPKLAKIFGKFSVEGIKPEWEIKDNPCQK